MVVVCIFLASLCFTLIIEALQTLVHVDQQDTMHLPLIVLGLAVGGIILNGICYCLIGGFTSYQKSFMHISSTGTVVLDRVEIINPNSSSSSRRNSKEYGSTIELKATDYVDKQRLEQANAVTTKKKQATKCGPCWDISRDFCSKY